MNKKRDFNLVIDSDNLHTGYLKDIFYYRQLFYFLAWKDILVRYKQTILGFVWAFVRPCLNMLVFVLVFNKIAHLSSEGVPYALFVLSGMLPWQLFSSCLIDTSNSLLHNSPMISKVYFPRVILPVSTVIVSLVDFALSLGLISVLFLALGISPQWHLLFLPVFIVLLFLLCLGTSLWLSALTVRFRDFRFIVPFCVQFGIFVSPVGYGSFLIPEAWRYLYFLNPIAGLIEGFRWSFFGTYHDYLLLALIISCALNVSILISGFYFFRKMEKIFADII